MNAVKHGVFSSEAVIRVGEGTEDPEELEALKKALSGELDPRGALEELLVDQLVTIVWRKRRLLRYEVGKTREQADAAVSSWHAQERAAAQARRGRRAGSVRSPSGGQAVVRRASGRGQESIRTDRASTEAMLEFFRAPGRANREWESTEELAWHHDQAARCVEALNRSQPLSRPTRAVADALVDIAMAQGVDVQSVFGVTDMLSVDALTEEGRFDRSQVDALMAEVRWDGETDDECVERLRNWWADRLEACEQELEARLTYEDQRTLAASLPDADTIQKILRYEGHLGREFDRTLRQLRDAQARRGA